MPVNLAQTDYGRTFVIGRTLLLSVLALTSLAAYARNYRLGNCLQGVANFTKIQTGVNVAPPGSTIFGLPWNLSRAGDDWPAAHAKGSVFQQLRSAPRLYRQLEIVPSAADCK
jgi:hypothetical protein